MEQSFIMIKPDGVSKNLIGEIVKRFSQRGFTLRAAKLMCISPTLAKQHYAEHVSKGFYPGLEDFICGGPVFAMVWQGESVIAIARSMMGPTDAAQAASGTIRGDFATSKSFNIIHGSDSAASAEREIKLFFKAEELV